MLLNQYLMERLAREHHRELLRRAEEGRRARVVKDGNGRKELPAAIAWGLQDRREAERLGRELGRVIYSCYSELLDRGLRRDEATELVKGLIERLCQRDRNGRHPRLGPA